MLEDCVVLRQGNRQISGMESRYLWEPTKCIKRLRILFPVPTKISSLIKPQRTKQGKKTDQWYQLLPKLAALSKPRHSRSKVCSWVSQLEGIKPCHQILPPSSTGCKRRQSQLQKPLRNQGHELSNTEGKHSSGRKRDTYFVGEDRKSIIRNAEKSNLQS